MSLLFLVFYDGTNTGTEATIPTVAWDTIALSQGLRLVHGVFRVVIFRDFFLPSFLPVFFPHNKPTIVKTN